MKTIQTTKTERQYYIDWLRILLIISVFLFHIGMIFNTWGWHIKNDVQYKGALWYIMVFMHYWRMPLLFLISGAGTWFALGKRSSSQYLGERFRRLIIPFLAGIFILVPVQVYIEKSTQYQSLIDFYPHMFDGIYPTGNFSWHHLWFILYLFFISLIISPFLKFFKSTRFELFKQWLSSWLSKPLMLNIYILPLLISQIILRPYFPEETHALFNDWAFVAFDILFFMAGFVMLSNNIITEAIKKQRYLFLIEAVMVTVFMYTVPFLTLNERIGDIMWDISAIFVAWSWGITAIGFAKKYLNFDSRFRKLANEAIYPFYLLHQPVIVVVGFFVLKYNLPTFWEVLIIMSLSFIVTVSVYRFIIYPFNLLRIIFGLKKLSTEKSEIIRFPVVASIAVHKNQLGENKN